MVRFPYVRIAIDHMGLLIATYDAPTKLRVRQLLGS